MFSAAPTFIMEPFFVQLVTEQSDGPLGVRRYPLLITMAYLAEHVNIRPAEVFLILRIAIKLF